MTLEDAYYCSQIIAAVAVVASLIYLAVQTRQTARTVRAQMNQTRSAQVREAILRLCDPTLGPVHAAGGDADPAMDVVACRQFFAMSHAVLSSVEETYREWREGLISNDRWNSTRGNLRATLASPGYCATYKLLRERLDPGFVQVIDTLLEEVRGKPWRDIGAIWKVAAARELASGKLT